MRRGSCNQLTQRSKQVLRQYQLLAALLGWPASCCKGRAETLIVTLL
jgi:hypothetical protein